MTGAIFVNARLTAPWGVAVPHVREFAATLAPGTEHLVIYHLIAHGHALARIDGMPDLELGPGDIMILPHGDAHRLSNGSPTQFVSSGASLVSGELLDFELGGGGEATQMICGFFGCDRHAARLLLSGLPSMLKLHIRGDAAGEWLEASIRHLVAEAQSGRPGRAVLLSKMAEAIFVESLCRHIEGLPPEQSGWLTAARDPIVGRALALLHREPQHPWTLETLAIAAAASRSVLAERFARLLGEPPLAYLARLRMQAAARLLQCTEKTIMQLAGDVGYGSEAAFSRAFKREFGLPPAQYRRSLKRTVERRSADAAV
jgi:AraC-like DNA-binding protein